MELKPTTIVHCKKEPYDVYIGRPSKWGNPFVIGKDGDRTTVIMKYRFYLLSRHDLILASEKELKGKRLGCWCGPEACHGDVLAALADNKQMDCIFSMLTVGIMAKILPGWDVNAKLNSVKGDGAFARIWLGVLPDMTLSQATAEAKRAWPRQFEGGLLLKHQKGDQASFAEWAGKAHAIVCKTTGMTKG